MSALVLIAIILLLTMASAFCSLSEIAFFSLPPSKMKAFRTHNDPQKRACASLLAESRSLLVTIFLLNTIVNILVQNCASDLFAPISQSFWLTVFVPLGLVLIFGELLPKYLGLLHNEKIALACAPFYVWFQSHTTFIRTLITHIANFFSRILFFYLKVEKPISEEELEHILSTSEGRGIVQKEEAKLVQGYLSMEGKYAKDLMIPASRIPFYDIDLPLSKLFFYFTEKRFESVVVCKGSLDHFLGMVRASDFFFKKNEIQNREDMKKILYRPFFVPETTSLKLLLEQFGAKRSKLALVVDEYGAITGMISSYDLMKEISKTLLPPQEKTGQYSRVSKEAIIATGTMPLDDLQELFGQEFETAYHPVTIAGYLIEMMGHIPQSGESFETGRIFFRILASDQRRIQKIYIQKKDHEGKQ